MYDLAIIGAGWAGVNAAKKAKQLGLKTILIEKGELGGTCLNRGCIPTKALIQSAKIYNLARKSKNFGVLASNPAIDFSLIQGRKDAIVSQLRQGLEFMLGGVEVLQAEAKILSGGSLSAGEKKIETKAILVATGSMPMQLDALRLDHKKVISSDDILNLREVPKTLLIVGGGVIGCEFAGLFSSLGSQVTVVEKLPQLLPGVDSETAQKLEISFKKKGIKVNTNSDAKNLPFSDYEFVLLAVGRTPNSAGLGLEEAGVRTERGKILVDEYLRTNVPGIYSAGDSTAQVMLAHFAAYQGVLAAENIATPQDLKKCSSAVVPNCIFTEPEIACVGPDEARLARQGIATQVHKFDFLGSGMARIIDEAEGFIKIISDKQSGRVLSASLIGPRVTELVSVLGLAAANGLTLSDIKKTIFAHPTLAESIHEAAS